MFFYIIWEFITLYHFKKTSPSVEGEIIEMRLYSLKNLFRNVIFPVLILSLILLVFSSLRGFICMGSTVLLVISLILAVINGKDKNRKYDVIVITSICLFPFLLFWPTSPFMVMVIAGMIAFIKSIKFLFTISNVSAYSLKARYIIMQIMIIILMAVTFNLAVNYIPGS